MAIMKSWLNISSESHFSLANIPFGIISTNSKPRPRPAIAIGEYALDLDAFCRHGGFSELRSLGNEVTVFQRASLNAFADMGRPAHKLVRQYLQDVLRIDTPYPQLLKESAELQKKALLPLQDIQNHMPLEIGDYTDFFAGRNHAFNVGMLFRGPENALNPNYNHIPVAYHGRASSIVISGTPLHRPYGQILQDPKAETKTPATVPCKRLDIELEMAMFVGKGNSLGKRVSVEEAEEHVFGYAIMNDWSARDVQMWEYQPLGPFNAKNFGTTISPWIVLADALEPFRTTGLDNKVHLQNYLQASKENCQFDIELEVDLSTSSNSTTRISKSNAKYLLWSWPQMIAHHTVGGCNLRTGDLFGSGTISGSERGSYGSILEQTQGGKESLKLNDGEERKFLEDGDSVTIRGRAGTEGAYVGFGECTGRIEPAIPL